MLPHQFLIGEDLPLLHVGGILPRSRDDLSVSSKAEVKRKWLWSLFCKHPSKTDFLVGDYREFPPKITITTGECCEKCGTIIKIKQTF